MIFSRRPLVVTHDNHFHPDDVCAVAVLHIILKGKYRLVRTRDPKIIEKADYVVDVGDIHDPLRQRFDHHQKGGAGARENGIPYASFGLVWKEYGEDLTGSKDAADDIDKSVVAFADAMDNGVDLAKGSTSPVPVYSFSDFLFSWNPVWNEEQDFDRGFRVALSYAVAMLEGEILKVQAQVMGKKITEEIYQKTEDKRIIVLDGPYPWRSVLISHPEPRFVIRPTETGVWNVKAVPVSKTSFETRISFPAEWAGLRGEELETVSGVPGATFCHNGRFVAVTKTKEGALALAKKALGE
ncbi:MAG: MYG1 family protein [bacterium]|nr:MYG1 family protein [bacterium]